MQMVSHIPPTIIASIRLPTEEIPAKTAITLLTFLLHSGIIIIIVISINENAMLLKLVSLSYPFTGLVLPSTVTSYSFSTSDNIAL